MGTLSNSSDYFQYYVRAGSKSAGSKLPGSKCTGIEWDSHCCWNIVGADQWTDEVDCRSCRVLQMKHGIIPLMIQARLTGLAIRLAILVAEEAVEVATATVVGKCGARCRVRIEEVASLGDGHGWIRLEPRISAARSRAVS